jgi:hypothetical protein
MTRRTLEVGSLVGATGSALSSAAASICCVGPIGIAILGVNGAIFAAGLKPYRWYLLGGSLLLLAVAFWVVYRPPALIANASCPTRVGRWQRIVLLGSAGIWAGAVILQFVADWLGY